MLTEEFVFEAFVSIFSFILPVIYCALALAAYAGKPSASTKKAGYIFSIIVLVTSIIFTLIFLLSHRANAFTATLVAL